MKLTYLTGFAVCVAFTARSQTVTPNVVASDGGHTQGSGGSISWTIGEPISETYSNASNITTMGFHQPEIISLADMIAEQGNGAELLVYPNPVLNEVTVDFAGIKQGSYSLEIIDVLGRLLYRSDANISSSSQQARLRLGEYASGSYFLLINGESLHKTVKLIKTN
jgi:hypothetical protein